MPFKNHSYYSPDHEVERQLVNEWIRNGGFFNGLIDFDKIMHIRFALTLPGVHFFDAVFLNKIQETK